MSEQWSSEGAVCPYCGHLNKPDADGYVLYAEDCEQFECSSCQESFQVEVYVRHSWTTRRRDVEE